MISYFLMMLTAAITRLICKFFLDIEIKGRENLPKNFKGYIISSNHQTLIDSWFIIVLMRSLPCYILQPSQVPWNVPEFKNYYRTWLMRFFFSHLRCIPLTRGKMRPKEHKYFREKVKKILRKGCLLIFFEGTRTRTGKIGEAKSGVGQLVYDNRCQVIPVKIEGFNQILPVGAKWLKLSFFQRTRVSISYGQPISFTDLIEQNGNQKTYLTIAQRLKQAVEQL